MSHPIIYPVIGVLPKHNLIDSVRTEQPVKRKLLPFRLLCKHPATTTFTHTDHRPGPGWMSDSYAGICCTHCGKVVQVQRTH